MLNGESILITGGTDSFGKQGTKNLLPTRPPKRLVIYSCDELKQFEMSQIYDGSKMRYLIGDVRDAARLDQAMRGIDCVIHAAALKQVLTASTNQWSASR